MIYTYVCDGCQSQQEISRSMASEPSPVGCRMCGASMRQQLYVPQIIGEPYHLKDGNRFQGDATDKLAYDRKYSHEAREKRYEADRKWSAEDAQRMGAEMLKPEPVKSLLDTAIESGARPRG